MADDRVDGYPLILAAATGHGTAATTRSNPTASRRRRSAQEQRERLGAAVEASFTATTSKKSDSAEPDEAGWMVIMLRLRSSVDELRQTLRHFDGMELLQDLTVDVEVVDEDDSTGVTRVVSNTIYMLGPDARSRKALRALWDAWVASDGGRLPTGFSPWREVFALLEDVRPWGPTDRIDDGLAAAWAGNIDVDDAPAVRAELELWFRSTERARQQDERNVTETVARLGGSVVDVARLSDIAYHAVLVEIPAAAAAEVLAATGALTRLAPIAKIRPQSAAVSEIIAADSTAVEQSPRAPAKTGTAANVALLDGIPDGTHPKLVDRVRVVTPGGAPDEHATAMASSIIYGDLIHGTDNALTGPLLVQPIFKDRIRIDGTDQPTTAHSRLPVAVMHEALTQLWAGRSAEDAPLIVVIAAGQTGTKFESRVSPWGRLIDAWAAKHGALFIVSAGNRNVDTVHLPRGTDASVLRNQSALRRLFLDALPDDNRGVLPPGDAINALTVGSYHEDVLEQPLRQHEVDPLGTSMPSPLSRYGNNAAGWIKPEILVNGGKVIYRPEFADDRISFYRSRRQSERGIVAAIGPDGAEKRMLGTSFAAGVLAHRAARIAELLSTPTGAGTPLLNRQRIPAAVKALLVNSASWPGEQRHLAELVGPAESQSVRAAVTEHLGYGRIDEDRIAIGDRHRATVLVTGMIWSGSSRTFALPLPPTLSGRAEWRRVSATVAWMSPVNPRHQQYREARLSFTTGDLTALQLRRTESEYYAARRGTVQHELFEGTRPIALGPTSTFDITVQHGSGAGSRRSSVLYALAVTFEVHAESDIEVYSEITQALRASVPISVAPVSVEVRADVEP